MTSISRHLKAPPRSFFLFGPRGVGKSTWLKQQFPKAPLFDLLDLRLALELTKDPMLLEAKLKHLPANSWVVIDEIQKIPPLLDVVHRLIENQKLRFALSGSSARKLKRGGANLLASRASRLNIEGFSFAEIPTKLQNLSSISDFIEWGTLPSVVLEPKERRDILRAYLQNYLKEEIKEEGLVRKLPPFLRFLEIAGIFNGQVLNGDNIARDASIPRKNVDEYISILEDTLLSYRLPAFKPGIKVKEKSHPKLYWFDSGVARSAAGLLDDPVDSFWKGFALETYLFHELRVYNQSADLHRLISYYRVEDNQEIDFVIETKKRTLKNKTQIVAIEVKSGAKWNRKWEKSLRAISSSNKIDVKRKIVVYGGDEKLTFEDIEGLPLKIFLEQLHQGKIF